MRSFWILFFHATTTMERTIEIDTSNYTRSSCTKWTKWRIISGFRPKIRKCTEITCQGHRSGRPLCDTIHEMEGPRHSYRMENNVDVIESESVVSNLNNYGRRSLINTCVSAQPLITTTQLHTSRVFGFDQMLTHFPCELSFVFGYAQNFPTTPPPLVAEWDVSLQLSELLQSSAYNMRREKHSKKWSAHRCVTRFGEAINYFFWRNFDTLHKLSI